LPQQHAADRTFVAPLSPVTRLGKPGDTAAALPDTHAPYHSRLKFRFADRCLRATQPNWLFILGDFLDFYSVSFHDRSPGRVTRLQDEIDVACELLRMLEKSVPNAQRVFCLGNHEFRLERYLAKNAPAIHGLKGSTIDEMLHLTDNGWRIVPYREMVIFGGVGVTHDVGHAGVGAARQSMLAMMSSMVIGHTHRAQSLIQRTIDGGSMATHMLGWLGEPSTIDYEHSRKLAMQWSHGMGYGAISDDCFWQLQQVDLNGTSTLIGGERVTQR